MGFLSAPSFACSRASAREPGACECLPCEIQHREGSLPPEQEPRAHTAQTSLLHLLSEGPLTCPQSHLVSLRPCLPSVKMIHKPPILRTSLS